MPGNQGLQFDLNLEQKQILSQKMIQSAQILQMNAEELSEYVKEAALENPVIEIRERESVPGESGLLTRYEWLHSFKNTGSASYSEKDPDDERPDDSYNYDTAVGESLSDYLRSQMIADDMPEKIQRILSFMIESLDERGYMTEETGYIGEIFSASPEEVGKALAFLQSLDPAGVGARSIGECLTLQARRRGILTPLMEKILAEHLEDLAGNRLPAIAKAEGAALDDVRRTCEEIRALNPKPGTGFSDREQLRYINPDVLVIRFEDHTDIALNDSLYPGVGIDSYYSTLFRESEDREVVAYLENKIRQAEWIRDCIVKRDDTLLRIARQIYSEQQAFFEKGPGALRPLRLSDVAGALGIHESTVSRAVRGKYLQCVHGVFPLNYFFPSGVRGSDGEGRSSTEIKRRIREIISGENRKKPLSDQKICELLEKDGIRVSRRAVAKYRDELGIPAAAGRKEY